MTIEREVKKINQVLMDRYPFWAIHAARIELRVGDTYLGKPVPTAVIDGEFLTINAEYWDSLIADTRYSLYSHEIGHIGLGHHLRRDERDFALWNKACDYELNLVLFSQGYTIPKNWCIDQRFKGWSAERIYAYLVQLSPPPPPPPPREEGDETGDKEGDENTQSDDPKEDGDDTTGGKPKPGEDGDSGEEPNPSGEVWDPTHPDGTALEEGEKQERREKLSSDIQMADAATKSCGNNTTADTKHSLNRIIKPKKNWRSVLDRWITERGAPCGRSWSKMDRRSMANRIYQPGEIRDGIDWLLFAVDISGSVGRREYEAFASHMDKIRENVQVNRITMLPFNEIVQQQDIVELKPKDKTPTDLWIGGGTAFAPIFNWVRRQPHEPDGIIVFTDLCCDNYGEPTRCPILWASSDEIYSEYEGWSYTNVPPFGDVVQIDISQD